MMMVSPEEAHKQHLKSRSTTESRIREALPLIAETRTTLRRIEAIGISSPRLIDAREKLALLEEDFETFLVSPIPEVRR